MNNQLDMPRFAIGVAVRQRREDAEIRQNDLAELTGLSQTKIHRLETAASNFNRWLSEFWVVCQALDADPIDVLLQALGEGTFHQVDEMTPEERDALVPEEDLEALHRKLAGSATQMIERIRAEGKDVPEHLYDVVFQLGVGGDDDEN